MSLVAHDLQPKHAEPAITTRKHEDSCGLGFIGAANSPSAFSGHTESVNDLDISIQGGQTWLVDALLCATCTISDP
jgi:hypothetical protein